MVEIEKATAENLEPSCISTSKTALEDLYAEIDGEISDEEPVPEKVKKVTILKENSGFICNSDGENLEN